MGMMMMRGGMGGGPKKPVNPETKKRVVRLFAPYKTQVGWIVVYVLLSAVLGLLSPFFLKTLVNEGLIARNLDVVTRMTVYTLLATLGGTALALAYGYLSTVVGQRIMRDLRDRLYAHLQGMSLRFFTGTRTGEIQSRLANDVGGVQGVVSDTAANVLSNVTTVISTLVVMIVFDWRLTLLSVGILPVFALIGARVGEKGRGLRGTVQSQLADLNATMQETLSVSGVLLTKTSGRQALSLEKFSRENEAMTATQVTQAMLFRFFFNLIGLSFSVTPVLVYWLAGYLIVGRGDTNLSLGTIVAFTSLQARLFFPLTSLLNVQVEVTSAFALFDRIFEYLDLKQDITDAPNAVALSPGEVRGAVAMHGVNFWYERAGDGPLPNPSPAGQARGKSEFLGALSDSSSPSPAKRGRVGERGTSEDGEGTADMHAALPAPQPTLSDITFEARPGELVALVGASGAGKTTLTYLIPRLYDVDSGSVTIDGRDVREITLESLGKMIAVVTQETYLVHDTIRENLRYGRPDATDDELIAAAQAAAIHAHIASLPDGYDTIVGERGYKLSGGEKQRIAIARAILKNPRILILDEATSALDTQSERLIQAALTPLMAGRTTFAIAHRLSTILAADQILVLEAGRIVERGTHAALLARGGAYARLYAAQFEHAPDEERAAPVSV